jgi:leader peptidase (prepilin peptidase)/N-methyltransferase
MVILEYLEAWPGLLVGLVFLLGLLVGSFLNVVIYRLPVMMQNSWQSDAREILELPAENQNKTFNLIKPDSTCPACGHRIRWYENIPVISWLFLRGKCSACGTRISARYPLIELVAAIMGATVAWHTGYGLYLVFMLYATWALLSMSMIDFDTTLLPDSLTYPFLWAGLLAALLGLSPVTLEQAVVGAMAGYLCLWSLYWLFKLLTGKEGMGYGDFKLLAGLGAWVGWSQLPVILLLSSVVGAVVGILLIQTGAVKRNQGIPFGPYLAAAGWITLLWGDQLVAGYLGFFSY